MAGNVKVCDISPEVMELVKKFRMRKEKNTAALILKIKREEMLIVLDEEYVDISIEDLVAELPEHQPRYVVVSYVLNHDDGRVSYPLIFIFISPEGVKPDLQMMYAGSKLEVVHAFEMTKVFELRSVEEFTEEWLVEKLRFFR